MSRLFSQINLGGVALPNRVVVPPMCQYLAGTDGLPTPWHHMHYGTMAISGAGLVIVEATAVEAVGRISPNDLGLYNEDQEEALRDLIARIRSYSSTRFGVQLSHAGRKASNGPFDARQPVAPGEGGWVPIAPSPIPPTEAWTVPAEMDEADISRVVSAFVAAAERADLHAAQALGAVATYPQPFWRLSARYWPGYELRHPNVRLVHEAVQPDPRFGDKR